MQMNEAYWAIFEAQRSVIFLLRNALALKQQTTEEFWITRTVMSGYQSRTAEQYKEEASIAKFRCWMFSDDNQS